MKNKKCKVTLVSEDINKVKNWIEKINQTFEFVQNSDIRKVSFESEKIIDYRSDVYFESKESKNNIYIAMNQIKANPITFLR